METIMKGETFWIVVVLESGEETLTQPSDAEYGEYTYWKTETLALEYIKKHLDEEDIRTYILLEAKACVRAYRKMTVERLG